MYGRLFPDLASFSAEQELLFALGRAGGLCDCGDEADEPSSLASEAAGWPFFGQFIAHDITADRSAPQVHADLSQLRNARSPRLNLEGLYGDGPVGHPFLFQRDDPATLLTAPGGRDLLRNEAIYQPNANFASAFQVNVNSARSNYTGLQLQYRRPLSHGIQILANYTFSHALDNASNDVVSSTPGVIISGVSDYASSNFDVRHSFSSALSFNLPTVGKNPWVSEVTKDWSLQSVIVARSGFPFNAVIYGFSPGGYATSRPDRVVGQPIWIRNAAAPGGQSLNPDAFAIPDTTRQGTEGRNDIAGFGLTQVDLSLGRLFPIRERCKFQFRVDVFNLLNHPNFTNPSALVQYGASYLASKKMLNNGLGGLNPLFQQGGPRSMQLSAKITF